MGLEQNKYKISTAINFLRESFKIIISSLLSIFVSQSCGGNLCTATDRVDELTSYDIFVLAFNFIVLGMFIILYFWEVRREKWMIEHLKYESSHNEYHLNRYNEKYPEILDKLRSINQIYLKMYELLGILYLLNIIISGISIFGFNYLDYKTPISFITNVVLSISKIFRGRTLASRCLDENIALSYYNINNISYNVINPKYKNSDIEISINTNVSDSALIKQDAPSIIEDININIKSPLAKSEHFFDFEKLRNNSNIFVG